MSHKKKRKKKQDMFKVKEIKMQMMLNVFDHL